MNNEVKKKTVLWVSPYAPYDRVFHGGGKTHNFYIKYLKKSNEFDITLVSLCLKEEVPNLDLDKYGIKNLIAVTNPNFVTAQFRRILNEVSYVNPWNKYGGICLNYERWKINELLGLYIREGNEPDIVILQWTFAVLYAKKLRSIFPDAVIVAIEEDVTFLNYQRKISKASSKFGSLFWKKRYKIGKQIELDALDKADIVVTNNPKDTNLLLENGVSEKRIFTSAPYFDDYSFVQRDKPCKDIIFWGAMYRPENYKSAIWFIKQVLPLLKDKELRFIIIGGQPNNSLYKYESEHVIITGYVEKPEEWFGSCKCMVAPLVGGAGIKIKILEALSAGIPVLTNTIGIEGIEATDQKEFFYCKTPQEYADCINKGMVDEKRFEDVGLNAKKFIKANYSLEIKLNALIDRLTDTRVKEKGEIDRCDTENKRYI
ncbi:MAG: glycosyltransferase [Lachnospiraceae bacterium]|nr:glycosyltransferase [Lachnospiraceae bacterium]